MLTATKQATTGYWIETLKKNIYSIEEINYFIYNHIDLVYRDFFCDALFDYIEKELEQPAMAEDLRSIAASGGNTGDFVKYILNASYYYNGRELANIAGLVSNIDNMGKAERIKIQGDAYYRAGNYNSALKCYLEILRNIGTEELSSSFYGRIAYIVGTIYAKLFMNKSANAYFSYAYELSPDPVYAKACIYMSILAEDDEEMLAAIVKYKITDDALDTMKKRVWATRHEIETLDDTTAFFQKLESDEFAEEVLESWKSDYYNMLK